MDPATVALAIKALDVAFIMTTYLMRRAESEDELDELLKALDEIADLRAGLKAGAIQPEEAKTRMESVAQGALTSLREAMVRL